MRSSLDRCLTLLPTIALGVSLGCVWLATRCEAKTFVFCYEGNPETLNPQVASTSLAMNAARPVFSNLVQFKPGTTEIIPDLAESWTISPDGREYTFHLRPNVRFHASERFKPSRPLSADDVLFSLNRQWKPDHPFHHPTDGTFDYFQDLGFPDLLQSIDKIDDRTVRFRLKRPEAPFLTDLTMPFTMILSEEYATAMLKAGTPALLDTEPIGTGPFVFQSYRKDVLVRYAAFEDYWAGRPTIDTLVLSITENAAVRLNKLISGECQVMALPNPRQIEKIQDLPGLSLLKQDGLNIGYLALNAQKAPFSDVRVRRAVNLAIDRSVILADIYGKAGLAIKNPLPVNMWSYNDAVENYPYDVAKAQSLMSEAGYPNGFDTELWYMPISRPYNPASKQMAELIAEDLLQIGIRVKLITSEWGDYRSKLQAGAAPMALYGWIGDNGDPDNFLSILFGCRDGRPGPGNIAKWCNAAYDRLIEDGKTTTDQRQRSAIYARAQALLHDEAPVVPIAQSSVLMALRKEVSGFKLDPLGRYFFDRVDTRGSTQD